MKPVAPTLRVLGLLLTLILGVQMAMAVVIALLLLLGSKAGAMEVDQPVRGGGAPALLATAVGLAAIGGAMAFASWKVWRSPSRFWLSIVASLLALQPVMFFLDTLDGDRYHWGLGVIFPALALALLFWPARRHVTTIPANSPESTAAASQE